MTKKVSAFSHNRKRRVRGLTLIELLVAMVLMGLITVATVSMYSMISSSSKTVDASQELNDNARFIFEVIGQALRIAGYQEYLRKGEDAVALGGNVYPAVCTAGHCPIIGFNNASMPTGSVLNNFGTQDTGGATINFSDILVTTFSGSSVPSDPLTSDGTMIDCQGVARAGTQAAPADLGVSLFAVTKSAGEGEFQLSCMNREHNGSQPLVRGVETFQVMYGVDTDADSIPNRWVSAQDVSNWMQVRALRVGFVLRGAVGSAQIRATQTLYPLGEAFTNSSTESGMVFVAPADGRLRRAFATTFMIRNSF